MSPSASSELAKESRLWQPVTIRWFTVLFGFAVGYAILRYHILGWLAPGNWGALPPVSLVAFVAASVTVLIRIFR